MSKINRDLLIQEVVGALKRYSKTNESAVAIAIDGEWGVGKSYMYRSFLEYKIRQELGVTPIYTSVFGKKDENEIIQDLIAQFLTIENQKADSIKNIINGTLSLLGKNTNVDFLFKMFKKEHMRNTIVCIDDFERLSDKIPIQDVLGLISELKENKGCHIILLCNQSKIGVEQKEDKRLEKYKKYREKIIDKTLMYQPTPFEQLDLVKDLLKPYKIYSEDLTTEDINILLGGRSAKTSIEQLKTTNLREIKKIIHCFNEYCEGLKNPYLDNEYTQILFCNAMLYCLINSMIVKNLEIELEDAKRKGRNDDIKSIEANLTSRGFKQNSITYIYDYKPITENIIFSSAKFFAQYQTNNIFTFRQDAGHENYLIDEQVLISKLNEMATQYQYQKEFVKLWESNNKDSKKSSELFYEKNNDNLCSLWFMLGYCPENFSPSPLRSPQTFDFSIFKDIGIGRIKEMIATTFNMHKDNMDKTWLKEKQDHQWLDFFRQKGIDLGDKLFSITTSS